MSNVKWSWNDLDGYACVITLMFLGISKIGFWFVQIGLDNDTNDTLLWSKNYCNFISSSDVAA